MADIAASNIEVLTYGSPADIAASNIEVLTYGGPGDIAASNIEVLTSDLVPVAPGFYIMLGGELVSLTYPWSAS